ncbi:MAG: hypothetical protein JWR85_4222 [Marmoricola sp.]|nr:hypothetical protein [Marmoricola sp.]
MTTTTAQLQAFQAALHEVNAAHYAELNAKIPGYFAADAIEFSVGKKNAKFCITTCGQKSVLLFVELATGNILKAAGFNTPAKGARGNIATSKPQAGSGWLYR